MAKDDKPKKPPVVRQGPAWAVPKGDAPKRPALDPALKAAVEAGALGADTDDPAAQALLQKVRPPKGGPKPKKTRLRDDPD